MKNLITTISGKTVPADLCRLVEKQYYLIGNINIENSGDIYLINGRYIRENTGRIVFNHTKKEYQLKNDSVIKGILYFKEEEPVFGYFEQNLLYNVPVILKNKEKIFYKIIITWIL